MKINVSHIAKLANLPLSSSEKDKLEKQLDETIKYIENLSEVDTKEVEPTSQVTNLESVTRGDFVRPSLSQTQALSNSKSVEKGFFKVKAIFKDES